MRHWCRYCGCILKITNTSGVCPAHADLPRLDPQMGYPLVRVRFDSEILLSEDEIEDVIGVDPLTYEACQQAVQNRIGHTGAAVLDVTEYEENPT